MAFFLYLTTVVIGALSMLLYAPLKREATVLGLLRPLGSWENLHGIENRVIQDTVGCEDLHYHETSGMLYSACGGDIEKIAGWYPGAGSLGHPENPGNGGLVLIDPKTMKLQRLVVPDFPPTFVTHGISLYSPPSDPETVYIFVVNHFPNPLWAAAPSTQHKAASRIEVFVHTVGAHTAKHLWSISHPLIRTPNDILALSEREFLVTNDHCYREGFMRLVEDVFHFAWTDTVHVYIHGATNVTATISTTAIPTNNGLGWGPDRQILISNPTGGTLYFAGLEGKSNKTLSISHSVQADGLIDNPHFFSDPYSEYDGKDYSGYLLPGIGRPIDYPENHKDPTGKAPITSLVWYLPESGGKKEAEGLGERPRLVFSDDGSSMRGVTAAVIVAIDPVTNDGKREGWLFATGVIAPHMLATKIDFATALS
ncbi:calcium-dependent phosphotriesterase [Hypoxylon crocopeplum]|nr:calcium-dependent phosphotriesterase [Hypoxylon crocopeplum]